MKKANRKTLRGLIVGITTAATFAFVFAFFTAHIGESLLQSRQVRDMAMYAQGIKTGQDSCRKGTLQPKGAIEGVYFAEPADTDN